MCDGKSHLNLVDLQRICEQLNLSTEGTKSELIAKILDLNSNDVPESDSSDFSRTSVFRVKITSPPKCDQSTQTFDESMMKLDINQTLAVPAPNSNTNLSKKMLFVFLIIGFVICFFGGFYAISEFFVSVEKIEIPVKHTWLDSWFD